MPQSSPARRWDNEHTDFDQANKKDANAVTGGKHTMSTTKKGQLVTVRPQPYARRNAYKLGAELGRLKVQYHPAHTLQVSPIICWPGSSLVFIHLPLYTIYTSTVGEPIYKICAWASNSHFLGMILAMCLIRKQGPYTTCMACILNQH